MFVGNRLTLIVTVMTALTAFSVTTAMADTPWGDLHPRRAHILDRVQNLDARIDAKFAEGKLTAAKAKQLHQADHRILSEEVHLAARHGGVLTDPEVSRLNGQLDALSRQIGA